MVATRLSSSYSTLYSAFHNSQLRQSTSRNNNMPPRSSRKRRAVSLPTSLTSNYLQVAQVDEDEDEDEVDVPTPTQTQRNRPREDTPEDDDDDAEEDIHNGAGSLTQLSKSLVRYALACEYSRTPIKRADINQKGTSVTYMLATRCSYLQSLRYIRQPSSRKCSMPPTASSWTRSG